MGLDMYLNAKRYISKYSDEELGTKLAQEFPELAKIGKPLNGVSVEAMYWRKANAIHKWFVDNVQNGVDDCGNYYVSRDHLMSLMDTIDTTLASRDSSNLPPQAGFFFGSTEADNWYWEDLQNTRDALETILNSYSDDWDFEYHSSW
jgi:hypothetical protein